MSQRRGLVCQCDILAVLLLGGSVMSRWSTPFPNMPARRSVFHTFWLFARPRIGASFSPSHYPLSPTQLEYAPARPGRVPLTSGPRGRTKLERARLQTDGISAIGDLQISCPAGADNAEQRPPTYTKTEVKPDSPA